MRKLRLKKCSIRLIENTEAFAFLDSEHRQGSVRVATALCSLGLFYGDELVAVAQFCYPRTAKKRRQYTAELLRLAFKHDVRIYRGASALIQHYISEYKPADLFTYQDTSGEATSVYEHAGMTLVEASKSKKYLVAPGKTRETAGKRECYSMASVVMRGPDALLKTSLGEIYRPNGKRKSNPDIFVEELGWHIEETTGDRVYEWVDANRTFYTYKITASDSDKYYYGVRQVAKANATKDDCLADDYFGSGGSGGKNKFRNWKLKHKATLQKEILGIYSRKAEAYLAEEELIGDSWRTDKLCLNGIAGGKRNAPVVSYGVKSELRKCEIHGESLHHVGGACFKCSASEMHTLKECPIHGETNHAGDSCSRCAAAGRNNVKVCPTHGETLHQGEACYRCASSKAFGLKTCSIHGETSHAGDSCVRCYTGGAFSERECAVHGLSTFRGENCVRCQVNANIELRDCPVHGVTKHQGGTCGRCAMPELSQRECPTHGLVSFTGDVCNTCRAYNGVSQRECAVHGIVAHIGDKCRVCVNGASVAERECPYHGLTKHQGAKCSTCSSQRTAHRRFHASKHNPKCRFCTNPEAPDAEPASLQLGNS